MDEHGLSLVRRKRRHVELLITLLVIINSVISMYLLLRTTNRTLHRIQLDRDKKRRRLYNLNALIKDSDVACRSELRVNRRTFFILCEMVSDIGGLRGTYNMSIEESVAMFLYTLAHHKKNRSIGTYFHRSSETVSKYFNLCLLAVLKLHHHLLKKPTPISDYCEDNRWKCFKVTKLLIKS